MLFLHLANLLPKGFADRVALKTLIPQHSFKVRGFKKLLKLFEKTRLSRIFLGTVSVLFLAGYQPTLAIPPIKQAVARAEFSQQENIQAANFSEAFNLPHPGYLTTSFSRWHPGIDIATGFGMPIHPIASGKVTEVSLGLWGLGHNVVIEHTQGFRSTYGHMGKIYVRKDDSVEKTSTLGTVGMTGRTSGPHTHLEVVKDGQSIDPLTILPALSNWPASAGKAPHGATNAHIEEPKTEKKTEPGTLKPKLPLLDISKAGQKEQDQELNQLIRPLLPQ